MKKIFLILLSTVIVFALAACTATPSTPTTETPSTVPPTASTPTETPSLATNGDSKILIAYFAVAENSEVDAISSASVVRESGRGFITTLADFIQTETGGDLFSIQTSVDYPASIMAVIDYAAKEQEDKARPELTSALENLDDYDTVFIGFPNWWYDMPMVMYSFFEEYDFSGKTIIPFCTHNGSRFSSTIKTIQELEPSATVITDGFTVNFKDAPTSGADIAEWLKKLGVAK